jgi:hypothetical protein
VEQLIIKNNAACFRLTEGTPPIMEPLLLDLGYLAKTAAADKILQGTYIFPQGTDKYTADLMKFLQQSLT